MMKLNTVHKRVLGILVDEPESRNRSDAYMYLRYLDKFYGIKEITNDIFLNKEKKYVNLGTVGRARRKCQELFPSLKADDDVEACKEMISEEYVEYAKRKY